MKAEDPDPGEERRWLAYWRTPVRRWTLSLVIVLLTVGFAWGLTRERTQRNEDACRIVTALLPLHTEQPFHAAFVRIHSDVC
jgi:hypothetical protein